MHVSEIKAELDLLGIPILPITQYETNDDWRPAGTGGQNQSRPRVARCYCQTKYYHGQPTIINEFREGDGQFHER